MNPMTWNKFFAIFGQKIDLFVRVLCVFQSRGTLGLMAEKLSRQLKFLSERRLRNFSRSKSALFFKFLSFQRENPTVRMFLGVFTHFLSIFVKFHLKSLIFRARIEILLFWINFWQFHHPRQPNMFENVLCYISENWLRVT